MTVIYGRSQTEIDDDSVTTCHTKCGEFLKEWIFAGVCSGYWLTGGKRQRVKDIMARCEAVMLGEKEYDKVFPYGANNTLYAAIGM